MDARHIGVVVNMQEKEEEGQQQQLQEDLDERRQQPESQDVGDDYDDEQDGETEEDEDNDNKTDQDDEIVDDTFLPDRWRQEFDLACRRIEQNDPEFITFEFVCMGLTEARAIRLGRALQGNTELTSLSVRFLRYEVITARGARAFARGVSGSHIESLCLYAKVELPLELSQLRAPSMKDITLYLPMGYEFATQLFESLWTSSKQMEQLTFEVDDMAPRVAQVIADYLRQSHVAKLVFSGHMSWAHDEEEDGPVPRPPSSLTMYTLYSKGVQHCQNIQDLWLMGDVGDLRALPNTILKLQKLTMLTMDIPLSVVALLAHGVSNAHQLETLILAECGLYPEHMSVLSPVLGNHRCIKCLRLHNNKIGDSGVMLFVEHWRPESIIDDLSFARNGIGFKGAELLTNAWLSHHHSNLHRLDLGDNKTIGFDGFRLVGEALSNHHSKLQSLHLVDVVQDILYADFGRDKAVKLRAKHMAAAKVLLEGVRANGHLIEARLDNPNFPTIVMEEIKLYVKANVLGRRAVLENQHILPSGVWGHFFAKEGMSSSLMFLFLRELPGVVMGGSRNSTVGRKRRLA